MSYYISKGDNMKNNRGFTLVEIISVIVLLGLIIGIAVPSVMTASTNVKKKTLQTKIDNIEQAAVLYGQNNRENFTATCNSTGQPCAGVTGECYCYNRMVTVGELATEDFIKYDNDIEHEILNSLSEEDMLDCEIRIYKKYNKIYAIYTKTVSGTENLTKCWYEG